MLPARHTTIFHIYVILLSQQLHESVQIRSKVIVPKPVRLAEELERQQLLEKEKRNVIYIYKINSIIDFIKEGSPSNGLVKNVAFSSVD
ncbi:BPK_HP2_G0024540.mRNA.1.CDS.1 [Saccharomyces cerevisiae]|nr:BPK_HP2_G0024540.mRNA.1.CDS.1 [Saccharomyces cerevisiae]CAI6452370.1 BPK_HP2_G0024540.mRNA.1.CDS.1 [Saccharomyces cerevisiae]